MGMTSLPYGGEFIIEIFELKSFVDLHDECLYLYQRNSVSI